MSQNRTGVEHYPSTLVYGSTTPTELIKIQTENPTTYHEAINAVQHETQRRLIWAVVQHDGRVSYKEMDDYLTVSARTKRKHMQKLEENDLLQRIDANFTFVEFHSDVAEVLLHHALTTWYDRLDD